MKELINQLAIASDELHKASVLLLKYKHFELANKLTWAATTIEGWSADILVEGEDEAEKQT